VIRVAIVDDEEPARLVLREYLDGEAGVSVVAECANGFEAVKAVSELKPDLLITDIQMPKLDGFEVLDLVGRETNVIFATAYDEYALKAFEVHAIDYLLKPFSRDRLREALARARARLAAGRAGGDSGAGASGAVIDAAALARAARPAGAWITRIVIRDGAEVHVVPIDRVDYVEAQDDYIAVHAGERTLLKDQALGSLESQLDPRRFVRIHRSYLLNLDRLSKLEPETKDTKAAVLRDGRRLPVSRSGYERLQQLL
jgi:two-component system LytT family response regulator